MHAQIPTRSPNDAPLTPLRFLERSAEVFPDKRAIIYGERRLTYAEFREAAERMALAIRARIDPGDRVAFVAPNIPELLIAHYAVPLAGGVLVALNPRLSRDEIHYILNHCGARLLFVDAEFTVVVGDVLAAASTLTGVIEIGDPEFGAAASDDDCDFGQTTLEAFLAFRDSAGQALAHPLVWDVEDERSVISINYTSGTTGRPKGVLYSHRGAYLNSLGEVFHNSFRPDSVYLWTLPMFHCNGWCTTWGGHGRGRHPCSAPGGAAGNGLGGDRRARRHQSLRGADGLLDHRECRPGASARSPTEYHDRRGAPIAHRHRAA